MLGAASETADVGISAETRERAALVTGAEPRAERNPDLLLLDEPTEGLAPVVVDDRRPPIF